MTFRFKYVVSCVMCQNNGAALANRACAYFEENDGIVSREVTINDMTFCVTVLGVLASA